MKPIYWILILVAVLVLIYGYNQGWFSKKPTTDTPLINVPAGTTETLTINGKPCQCYCSDVCGPRDRKDDDTPFNDAQYGVCFCKQRDKDNYQRNFCSPRTFNNSCCTQ